MRHRRAHHAHAPISSSHTSKNCVTLDMMTKMYSTMMYHLRMYNTILPYFNNIAILYYNYYILIIIIINVTTIIITIDVRSFYANIMYRTRTVRTRARTIQYNIHS